MKRTVLALLLAATPALGQEFGGALPPLKFGVPVPLLPDMPVVRSRPVLRRPAPPEAANPDRFDYNDEFRRALLAPAASDRWLVPTVQGDVMLVVQKGYLIDAELDSFCADLQEGVAGVPRVTGRASRIRGRFTLYVYDDGPLSESGVPGLARGEKAVMLRFVKEKHDPLFHELTHLLAGYSASQSLGEGIADVVQARLRPGRASAFMDANTDPHAESRRALSAWGPELRRLVGAPGHEVSIDERQKRFDFYYASWSFADTLVRARGMEAFWRVADAGGSDAAYRADFGMDRAALVAAWATATTRATR